MPCWKQAGFPPAGGMALATATIRGLILTVSYQRKIGPLYPQVLQLLIRSAMKELFV